MPQPAWVWHPAPASRRSARPACRPNRRWRLRRAAGKTPGQPVGLREGGDGALERDVGVPLLCGGFARDFQWRGGDGLFRQSAEMLHLARVRRHHEGLVDALVPAAETASASSTTTPCLKKGSTLRTKRALRPSSSMPGPSTTAAMPAAMSSSDFTPPARTRRRAAPPC